MSCSLEKRESRAYDSLSHKSCPIGDRPMMLLQGSRERQGLRSRKSGRCMWMGGRAVLGRGFNTPLSDKLNHSESDIGAHLRHWAGSPPSPGSQQPSKAFFLRWSWRPRGCSPPPAEAIAFRYNCSGTRCVIVVSDLGSQDCGISISVFIFFTLFAPVFHSPRRSH